MCYAELAGAPAETQPQTKFMVMQEGRLIFEGSQDELEASQDKYVQKFVRHTN